ncbi:hypothetical protein Tco_1130952 [Tanacetum coccineum]
MGEGSTNLTDPHHTPTIIQPSTSQPQKKQKPRKPKRKDTEVPQPSGPIDNVIDEAVYEEIDDSSGPRRQLTMGDTIAQTGFENVSKTSNDSLLTGVNTPRSDEDSLKLKELMELCTNLQNRVIDLEKTKTSQAQEITSLKRRVKRVETKGGSRTHGLKRLYTVGLSRRVESSDKEGLGEEDASKQGRIADIDVDAGINLVSTHFDADIDMFGVHDLVGNEVVVESKVVVKAAVQFQLEQEPIPTVSSQQPSQLNVQDKGKGKMIEPKPMKKLSKKDQLMLDEEHAFKLKAKEEEEDRLAREKA